MWLILNKKLESEIIWTKNMKMKIHYNKEI